MEKCLVTQLSIVTSVQETHRCYRLPEDHHRLSDYSSVGIISIGLTPIEIFIIFTQVRVYLSICAQVWVAMTYSALHCSFIHLRMLKYKINFRTGILL